MNEDFIHNYTIWKFLYFKHVVISGNLRKLIIPPDIIPET